MMRTPQPFNLMNPLQSLGAWWRRRSFSVQLYRPGGILHIGIGLQWARGWTDAVALWPLDDADRRREYCLRIDLIWRLSIAWCAGIEPEPLPAARRAFRRTRRQSRRFIAAALLLSVCISTWIAWNAILWIDGQQSGILAGLLTGAGFVALLFNVATIADCIDTIKRSRDHERITFQTPDR